MNLGLPSWSQLVDHIATELGYDPDIYRTFGSALELAEYYKLKKGKIGPLRSWMDRMWHSSDIDIKKSKVHEYIAKANFLLYILQITTDGLKLPYQTMVKSIQKYHQFLILQK